MSIFFHSKLRHLYYEKKTTVVNFLGSEIGLNSSKKEMRYNLKKRGLTNEEIDNLNCECGEANSLENIVAVSKTQENTVKAFCKACYR